MIGTEMENSPGPSDTSTAQLMTSGNINDSGTVLCSRSKSDLDVDEPRPISKTSPEHQGGNTGGVNANLRVLYCSNVSEKADFEILHLYMKKFGRVERIKLRLFKNPRYYDCYVTFSNADSACNALAEVDGKALLDSVCKAKLFNVKNLRDDDSDYVPSMFEEIQPGNVTRDEPKLLWHVASYKPGKENFISGCQLLQRKVGTIPKGNLKRYGKGILIKAQNDIQINMLTNFSPTEEGNISTVSPHRSFNLIRGIVYNRDVYQFDEIDILNMCPSTVYKVRKLRGTQHAMEFFFSCNSLPEFIDIDHARLWIKPFKHRPTQCYKCFEYGHVLASCSKSERCFICSSPHNGDNCTANKFCFHCEGDHSPNWRGCPQYIFQREVINTANNNHISLGEARRLVLGANKSIENTFASTIKSNALIQRPINHPRNTPQHLKPVSNPAVGNGLSPIIVQAEVHNVLPSLSTPSLPQAHSMPVSESQINVNTASAECFDGTNNHLYSNKSNRGESPPKAKRSRKSSQVSNHLDASTVISTSQDMNISYKTSLESERQDVVDSHKAAQSKSGAIPKENINLKNMPIDSSANHLRTKMEVSANEISVIPTVNRKTPKALHNISKPIDKFKTRPAKQQNQNKLVSSTGYKGTSHKVTKLNKPSPRFNPSNMTSSHSQSKGELTGNKK